MVGIRIDIRMTTPMITITMTMTIMIIVQKRMIIIGINVHLQRPLPSRQPLIQNMSLRQMFMLLQLLVQLGRRVHVNIIIEGGQNGGRLGV